MKLSRLCMMVSQSFDDARGAHGSDAAQFAAAAQIIALNFQTIAAANGWWRRPAIGGNGEQHAARESETGL